MEFFPFLPFANSYLPNNELSMRPAMDGYSSMHSRVA
jgi:hypothetical protein